MDQAGKSGFDRSQLLIGVVILFAAAIIGVTAYLGANSAKETVGNLNEAIDATAGLKATMPALNGSAAAGTGVPAAQQPAQNAQPNGSTATGGATAQPTSSQKEVTVDFLYADWCPHCQNMKPRVANVIAQLPADRFQVRYYNDADRGNATVAAVYANYMAKGMTGFPTFVANGEMRSGEVPEAEFKAWVCSKFSSPKPTGC